MKEKFTVLYVADQYSRGGAAQALIETVCNLQDTGIVVPIVATAFNNSLCKELTVQGVKCIHLGHRQFAFSYTKTNGLAKLAVLRPFYFLRYYMANLKALCIANAKIDPESIDIIHTNVNRNDIGGILSLIWQKPHVWHLREMVDSHFNLVFNRFEPYSYMNAHTDKFIAISDAVKQDWISKGIDAAKIEVIYDGTETSKIKQKIDYSGKEICKIVCVGEITEKKGQKELLYALRELKERGIPFVADFYGSGTFEYLAELRRLIQTYKLEREVKLAGYVGDVGKRLWEYDIAVNPSKHEGFGRTTIEYMAAGLCIIAHASGAALEIVDGNNGFLYNTIDDLINELQLLCSHDKYRKTLGTYAANYARARFDIEKNVMKYIDIYHDLNSAAR